MNLSNTNKEECKTLKNARFLQTNSLKLSNLLLCFSRFMLRMLVNCSHIKLLSRKRKVVHFFKNFMAL